MSIQDIFPKNSALQWLQERGIARDLLIAEKIVENLSVAYGLKSEQIIGIFAENLQHLKKGTLVSPAFLKDVPQILRNGRELYQRTTAVLRDFQAKDDVADWAEASAWKISLAVSTSVMRHDQNIVAQSPEMEPA